MKTIKWTLPFKNMNYLASLTEELARNPFIILITGIQDSNQNIDSCSITIKDVENIDEVILFIGATIGAHSVAYAIEMMEQQTQLLAQACICEDKQELPERCRMKQEDIIVDDNDDLFDQAEEIINIEEIPDSEAKGLLRKILSNFKK